MSESLPAPAARLRRRILWRLFLAFCVFSLLAFGALAWYVTTDSFQQIVRRRVIESAEEMTGGRVELGELHTIPLRLRVDARNLVIHGHEGPDQIPFLTVDRVQAELKIISLLSKRVGLHSVVLEHPVVHIIDYPDGTTNAPIPKESLANNRAPIEELIALQVSHIDVQRGELLWQDQKVPFQFSARDVAILLNYSILRRRYEAHVAAGSVDSSIQGYPSFVWKLDASMILSRGRADVSNLTASSTKSEFRFKGRLADFHNPQIAGDYSGTIDLGELAPFLHQPSLRRGTADFQGKGSWTRQAYATQGTVQAKDLEWSDRKVSLRNGRFNTAFAVTRDRFRLSSIKANLLGGDLAGEADVINWESLFFSPPLPTRRTGSGKVPPENLQRGSVRLQLAGFPLLPVLDFFSTRKLPLDRLDLSGNASGNVEISWLGSINDADTRLNLTLAPPSNPMPNAIPLRGQVDGVYRGSRDELEVSKLQLSTPGSEITAVGNLAATSSLRFTFTSHNVKEWSALVEEKYGRKLPFNVHGWGSLAGNATGKLSAFSFNGNLEVYDFDALLPPTRRTPAQTVHWDALSTVLQYSGSHIAVHNGSLIHGHTTAHFDGSIMLSDDEIAQNGPLTLHVDVRSIDVAEAAHLAGITEPLTGTANFAATISGTRANPHGDGHFVVRNGTIYGVDVPSLRTDLRLAGGELQFNNIETGAYNATFAGNASISTAGSDWSTNPFHLNLSGQNLDLARLPHVHNSRFAADGIADFKLLASGTTAQPSVEGHLHLKDLALDNEHFGDFYVDATTQGRQMDLKAHSEFDRADLVVAGNILLDRDFPSDLNLTFHHLDADSFLRIYLPGKITAHTPLDGSIQVRGPLRNPRELKAVAEIDALSADIEHVQIQSVGPIRFEVSDQVVTIESLHLAGSGTDFTAHGRAHLSGAQEVDMQLNGSVNMTLLQSFSPKVLSRGTLGISMTASGSLVQPVLQGRLEVKNTFISHNDFPSGLSDLNGALVFDRNRVQIEKLSGTTGGGTVALTGSAIYQGGVLVLDLGATAQDVRLRYPPGVSSTANADLRLTGSTNSALLSGDVVVTKLAVTPGFDFSAYIERSKQGVVFSQGDTLQSRLKLDVHVVTTPELQMQTAIARLSGNADFRVRGSVDRPVILGRVEVLEGEVTFNGTKYNLERGDVTFANPAKTQPVIDLQATTRVRDYDITVQFRGDASVPNGLKVTWQSEPQLPEGDVIALLALGRTREESAAANSAGSLGFGGEASNLLINEALNSTVNSRLQRLFGASRVKIDPQGLASETSVVRGPQVTIEQQVASNLTLTYSTNVSVSTQQIIQAEYNISRNMSIVALRDQNGVVSFDFRFRRRKK